MGSEKSSATSDASSRIELPARLDTSAAAHLHEQLSAQMGNDISLDGTAVEQVGGRCLDILLAARAACLSQGKALRVEFPSGAMVNDLAILGSSLESIATGDAP